MTGRAGDLLVFSAHLWHSGSRNTTGARRRVAIAQYERS
ncbi:MAG: phytanoyl-CoA dioxygenase family protein [Pseudomonadales bacterium]|nr:phytanoyl-CoA dioxygenase family protein [Pseudomonadales bacterium]